MDGMVLGKGERGVVLCDGQRRRSEAGVGLGRIVITCRYLLD